MPNHKITTPMAVAVGLILAGCNTSKTNIDPSTLAFPSGATDWVVVDPPQSSPRVTFPDASTGSDVTKAWVQLSNPQILNILSDTHSEISVGKFSADGKITYLVAQATASTGSYRVVMDYTNFIAEDAIDENSHEKIGVARVGVGLRLTANISTNTSGINLGSLMALGIAANLNQVRGTMSVDSIGIRIAGAGGPILSNSTIDETSIQKTLEAIAVIQSKIADPTTHLDPQVLWVKPKSPAIKPPDVAKSLL